MCYDRGRKKVLKNAKCFQFMMSWNLIQLLVHWQLRWYLLDLYLHNNTHQFLFHIQINKKRFFFSFKSNLREYDENRYVYNDWIATTIVSNIKLTTLVNWTIGVDPNAVLIFVTRCFRHVLVLVVVLDTVDVPGQRVS